MAVSRVIEVSFGRSSVALVRIDTAYFYNNGIIFKPTDIDLPASYQVHWADSPQASSTLETIGTAEGAPIPDDLWNRSRVIYGWIYLHPTEDSGVTAYEVRIYKNVRAGLPDGTEPTPAEQSTIDQLIGALNSAVEQTEDAEERIENMSVSATTLAEGSSATVTKSEQDGVVHLAFGIPKGATGDDGYSPTANVSKSGKTATITITDKNGTTTAQVEDGTDGIDGISPSVSVTDITGGHRVVITDKDGAKSFDVEDGATGATPNLTIGTVETLEPTDDATATITGTPENPVLNLGIPQGEQGEVTLEDYYKAFPTDTASGSIASFSDGADDLPLKSLVVNIDPVQDLSHGDPSPENICPISGWTEVDVEHTGKNLFDKSVVEVGALKADGTVLATGSTKYVSGYIRINPNTSYYLSNVIPATDGRSGFWYDADKNPIEVIIKSPYTLASFSVVSPSNAEYARIGCYVASADICQLELGSTATPYEPYTGRSITINLGQTVYGGKLDVLSGVLTVDRAMVDLATVWWNVYDTTNKRWNTQIQAMKSTTSRSDKVWSDRWRTFKQATAGDEGVIFGYLKYVYFYTSDTNNTPIGQLMYELAAPIEIQLTPNQVNSLLGVNNIWADSGDTEVEYRADTKLFIERLTAPDSADMIADANITSGQYFMVGNSLYKATANIANGSAIIVGTNCIRKSLSEALNEINA